MQTTNNQLATLLAKSRTAQKQFEQYSQQQVDEAVKVIAKVIYENAELLAREAVAETEMGVYEHKVIKNKNTAIGIWQSLKNKLSVGIIKEEPEKGLIHIAKPMGVIGSISPTTNPVITPLGNAMFALKGRNSIIIAPHPRAKKVSSHTVELMNSVLQKLGLPENLIQITAEPDIKLTQNLMREVDVVVATGGAGLVKAAYSSGKPAFGVGAGNVQVIIDKDYDYNKAAQDIIMGRSFDNGVICAGEQMVFTPKAHHQEIMQNFVNHGAYYIIDPPVIERFRQILFVDGKINGDIVGQSVQTIANLAQITIPAETTVIILQAQDINDLLCKEKMCPVLSTLAYESLDEAMSMARHNLFVEGAGHTVAIHSNSNDNIKKVGLLSPAARVIVNQPAIFANGAPTNGFNPTTTLGCGSWGNNSISENLTYTHLLNITRISYPLDPSAIIFPSWD